ncbi:MAG: hypothetical protein ACK53Y_13670, partial [bacterium]
IALKCVQFQVTNDENRQNFNCLLKYDDATGIQVSSASTKQQDLRFMAPHEHRQLEMYKSTPSCSQLLWYLSR